jgi:hypothetical protein
LPSAVWINITQTPTAIPNLFGCSINSSKWRLVSLPHAKALEQ